MTDGADPEEVLALASANWADDADPEPSVEEEAAASAN